MDSNLQATSNQKDMKEDTDQQVIKDVVDKK